MTSIFFQGVARRGRALRTWLFAALLAASVLSPVQAHAFLDHAAPKVGSESKSPPSQVEIWFTQDLEESFSKIEVADSQGKQVDKKDSHLDPKDRRKLSVSLPALPAGSYTVTWRVVAVDTHPTQGEFKFTVKS